MELVKFTLFILMNFFLFMFFRSLVLNAADKHLLSVNTNGVQKNQSEHVRQFKTDQSPEGKHQDQSAPDHQQVQHP